jgi:hypothetical protein
MCGDTMNVEHELLYCNIWSHWNSKKWFKEILKKTFNRRTTKDGYTRNITHNTESAAV